MLPHDDAFDADIEPTPSRFDPDDLDLDDLDLDDPEDLDADPEEVDLACEREEQRRRWLDTLGALAALPPPPEDADGTVRAEFELSLLAIYSAVRRVLRADLPGER